MDTAGVSNRTKYILRRLNDDDWKGKYRFLLKDQKPQPTWGFFEFGNDMPEATCYDDFMFFCSPYVSGLEFDKDSLRFEVIHRNAYTSQGYWQHVKSTDPEQYQFQKPHGLDPIMQPDHDFIEIGTCSPF